MHRLPEGVPPKEGSSYQEQASAMMAGGASMLAGTKVCSKPPKAVLHDPADIYRPLCCCSQAGKEMKKLKQNADVAKKGHKMAKDLGINISPKQAMDLAKAGSKLKK